MFKREENVARLEDIHAVPTAHLQGLKRVFLANSSTNTALTQFAFGEFKPNEFCENHTHPTMDECFFFIEGRGEYIIENEVVAIKPNTFLRIPAGFAHELRANKGEVLKFVYFGIATDL